MATQGNCNLVPGQQYAPGPNDFAEFDERAYGPDITRNFELGAKTQWLGGALILNGAIFLVEWEDPQLSSATVNASIPITINAHGAEVLCTPSAVVGQAVRIGAKGASLT